MIIGIGTDMVSIDRIDRIIGRFGTRFLDRIFTPAEQRQAEGRTQKMRFYAMRFAAKEAGWKALSPDRRRRIGWHDFEVTSTDQGQPVLNFHGEARDLLAEKAGQGGRRSGQIDLSLSDDGGFALAFVVLSAS